MYKVNYKSDFDFILRLKDSEGGDIGWPDYDFYARLWTSTKANTFLISSIGADCINCFNDNGRIHVVMNNHRLSAGQLNVEFNALLPDGIYPDGFKRVVSPMPLDVYLTKKSEPPTSADVPSDFEPFTIEELDAIIDG